VKAGDFKSLSVYSTPWTVKTWR